MEIFDCEQRSEAWFEARKGIPTASEFATILSKGRGNAESLTRKTYMLKLAGEILTGKPMESYSNWHMVRGQEMEPEAKNLYSFMTDFDVTEIGFIRNGDKGASPDGLIGDDGMLEIKTKLPHLTIDAILKDEFPPEHKAQCQGQLWVAERDWIDLVVYWPNLPLFVKRAARDEPYIKILAEGVEKFNDELREIVEKVRTYQ